MSPKRDDTRTSAEGLDQQLADAYVRALNRDQLYFVVAGVAGLLTGLAIYFLWHNLWIANIGGLSVMGLVYIGGRLALPPLPPIDLHPSPGKVDDQDEASARRMPR
jgi:hypothetical protein